MIPRAALAGALVAAAAILSSCAPADDPSPAGEVVARTSTTDEGGVWVLTVQTGHEHTMVEVSEEQYRSCPLFSRYPQCLTGPQP